MNQEEYNAIIAEAKIKLDEINNTASIITEKVAEANAKLDEHKSKAEENQALYASIEEVQATLVALKQSIDAKKSEIETRIDEINTFYSEQYAPARDQILDPTSGLQVTLLDIQQKKATLSNYEEQAKIHYEGLKNSIEQYNNSLKSLNETQTNINSFFETSRSSADEQLNQIKIIKGDIDKVLEQIKVTHEDSTVTYNHIETLHTNSKETNETIHLIKEDAETIKKKINTIYEQATNDTQGGAFGNQVILLNTELAGWASKIKNWTWILLCTIIGLFVVQVWINGWLLTGLGGNFYLRFTFTTPVIFYLIFCTKQYAKVRSSLDKYSFKKNMALSIDAHTELLKSNFPDNKKEILNFSLDVLTKIYDEPYFDETMKVKNRIIMDEIKFGAVNVSLNHAASNSQVKPIVPSIIEPEQKN